jgi:curved DNA-binding protein CbpA
MRSQYGWEDLPPGAVMDENTLNRLLQLGLVRWQNPNVVVMLIVWIVQIFNAVFPTNAEFERRHEDQSGATPAGSRSQSHNQSQSHKKPAPEDPFVTLGLAPKGEGVELADINKAYRALALKWHPDKNGQSEESIEMMQRLTAAKAACCRQLEGEVADEVADESEEEVQEGEEASDQRADRRGKGEHKAQREEEKVHREWNKRRNTEQRRVKRKQRQAAERRQQDLARAAREQRAKERGREEPWQVRQRQHEQQRRPTESKRQHQDRLNRLERRAEQHVEIPYSLAHCDHPVAAAIEAGAYAALTELFYFSFSPLAPVDAHGHTPLHCAARWQDARAWSVVISQCGGAWAEAVMARNEGGLTALGLLEAAVAERAASPAAAPATEADGGEEGGEGGQKDVEALLARARELELQARAQQKVEAQARRRTLDVASLRRPAWAVRHTTHASMRDST